VALLTGSAIGVVGQDAVTVDPKTGLPMVVTDNLTCTVVDSGTRGFSDALVRGASGARDQLLDCVHAMSDSRVEETGPRTFNDDRFGSECVFWGPMK